MSAPEESDRLLEKAQAGDRTALVTLLETLAPPIRGRIAAKIAPAYRAIIDVDDVMQVTYLEVFLRLKKFTSGGAQAFAGWVSRLAENNLVDAIRAMDAAKRPGPRQRVDARAAGREDSMAALVELLGVTDATPSRDAMRGEAGSLLEMAISSLPGDYGQVVRLYDIEGRSPAEVASQMGRSEGAVFMLRARAHDRLRETLGPSARFFSSPG